MSALRILAVIAATIAAVGCIPPEGTPGSTTTLVNCADPPAGVDPEDCVPLVPLDGGSPGTGSAEVVDGGAPGGDSVATIDGGRPSTVFGRPINGAPTAGVRTTDEEPDPPLGDAADDWAGTEGGPVPVGPGSAGAGAGTASAQSEPEPTGAPTTDAHQNRADARGGDDG